MNSIFPIRGLRGKKKVMHALHRMLEYKNPNIWWDYYPRTTRADIIGHKATRQACRSFPQYEAHRDTAHAAAGGDSDDSDSTRYNYRSRKNAREVSAWQGHDGNACDRCTEFEDMWIMEEWVFAIARMMHAGEKKINKWTILDGVSDYRGGMTLEEWIAMKQEEEEVREYEEGEAKLAKEEKAKIAKAQRAKAAKEEREEEEERLKKWRAKLWKVLKPETIKRSPCRTTVKALGGRANQKRAGERRGRKGRK